MRQMITLLFLVCILIFCCACQEVPDPGCQFYYLHTSEEYAFGTDDGIFAPEPRDISTEDATLDYLIRVYLEGSISAEYISPFPTGTRLERLSMDEGHLHVFLSEEYASLEGIHQTLANACLTKTCFGLSDARYITIHSGDKSNTYARSSFTTIDNSVSDAE